MATRVDPSFEQELERRLATNQRQRLSAFNPETLAWLALVPGWTDQLALDSRFPTGNLNLDDFLQQAASAGLVQIQQQKDRTDFWILANLRQDTLSRLQQDAGSSFLLKTCISLGERLNALREKGLTRVPQPVARWGLLASQLAHGPQNASNWLEKQVQHLLEEERTGEAVGWLETARPLADLFGGELETAVRLGQRRLELVYRRRQDERHVAHFLRREDQVQAFEFLLNNREGVWALHYLGMGGVGKTMLLRYITARLARERDIPTSRIDFDFISPDYPVRKPGQLLLELVAELRAYGLSATRLHRFTNSVANLHEALSKGETDYDPLSALSRYGERFDTAVQSFGNLIQERAAPDKPVVLILDTCEELAKFQPIGARLPALEFTFAILERVYHVLQRGTSPEELPFRVIFAGRRPLAQGGFGWELKPDQLGGKRHLLPDQKEYLALHELRGFDHQETKQFLCKIKQVSIGSAPMYKAILRHSQDTGRPADIQNERQRQMERRYRYNPFDLDLFADWIESDAAISAEQITREAQDPYIENRILERLKQQELVHLLPALTLLGRFDEAILRPLVADFDSDDFEEIYRELGDQEWIDYQRDEALDTTFLQINTNLLPRLRRYYNLDQPLPRTAERYYLIEDAKERLAPILEKLVQGPLSRLADEHLNGALRVLPPAQAAQLWADVERRIPQEANWPWSGRVLSRILAEDGAVNQPSHPLWPAVQATLAATQRHLQPSFNLEPLWQTVMATAANHPDPEISDWLEKRAFLNQLARQRYDAAISLEQVERLWQITQYSLVLLKYPRNIGALDAPLRSRLDQLNAAVCAALATILDAAEYQHTDHIPDPADLKAWADDLAELDYPASLVAFARMLAGRARVLRGNQEEGNRLLEQAASMPFRQTPFDSDRWFDWTPPRDLQAHLRLEALRLLPAELNATQWDNLGTWRMSVDNVDDIDRECLVAASLQQEMARRPVKLKTVETISKQLTYSASRQPTCLVHEKTAPLVVTLAQGYLALGLPGRAITYLQAHHSAATASGQDERTRKATEVAILHVVRRARLQRERDLIQEWVESGEPDQVMAAWPAAVLSGLCHGRDLPPPPGDSHSVSKLTFRPLHHDRDLPPPLGPWIRPSANPIHFLADSDDVATLRIIHTWNQCQSGTAGLFIPGSLEVNLQRNQNLARLPYAEAAVQFDFLETFKPGLVYFLDPAQPDTIRFNGLAWLRNFPGHVEEAFRLSLRFEALTGGRAKLPLALEAQMPLRRRGQIAFELGELLALRQPQRARLLLDRAISWLETAGDPIGALQAAICQATAMLRGQIAEADTRRYLDSTVHRFYDLALETIPATLPTWSDLTQQLDLGETNSQSWDFDSDWQQWLNRLLYCLAWSAATAPGDVHALPAYSAGQMPAELAFAAPDEAGASEASDEKSAGLTEYSCLFIGLVVIAVLFVLGYYGFNWLWNRLALAETVSTGWRIAAYLLTLVILFGLLPGGYDSLRQGVRARLAALAQVTLFINRNRPARSAAFRLDARTFRLRLRSPFLAPQDDSANWEADLPDWQSDEATLGEVDEAGLAKLVALRSELGRRSLPVRLHIQGRELHALPWEGLLARTLARVANDTPLDVLKTLQLWRSIYNNAPASASAAWGWRLGLIRVVTDRSAALAIEEGWRGFGRALVTSRQRPSAGDLELMLPDRLSATSDRNVHAVATRFLQESLSAYFSQEELQILCADLSLDPLQFAGSQGQQVAGLIALLEGNGRLAELWDAIQRQRPNLALPYQVLHLVGTPIQTGSDVQWQISSAAETESLYKQASIEVSRVGELFSADELPVQHVPLIVVQSEPGSQVFGRTAPDREQAGDVRAFAYKLLRAGAQAVLVMPALTYDAAPDVIRQIARAISGTKPPDLSRLLTAAQAARNSVSRRPSDTSAGQSVEKAGQLELALDLCLFMAITEPQPQPGAEKSTRSNS
jgi:hypothetical protein